MTVFVTTVAFARFLLPLCPILYVEVFFNAVANEKVYAAKKKEKRAAGEGSYFSKSARKECLFKR